MMRRQWPAPGALGVLVLIVLTINALLFALQPNTLIRWIQSFRDSDNSSSLTRVGSASPVSTSGPDIPLGDILSDLFGSVKLPVTATHYTDQRGKRFNIQDNPPWKEPLGKNVLVIDIDTRMPDNKNGIFNLESKIDWETVQSAGSAMLGVSYVNHFRYAKIHGYDYRFIHARKIEGHHDSWSKPRVLQRMLPEYQVILFMDADAIVQHLEVPLEFLLNRWGFASNTSAAMPIDTRERPWGDSDHSADSRGKTVLNSGVVVLQNLPHTHAMMQAWASCTAEERYPGCGHWKDHWSHEQRAFSEYIRYDFNPDGNNIVEIPCNEAMGYPGILGRSSVIDDCRGEFIRHYTLDKTMTKTGVSTVMMQSVNEILQRHFAQNSRDILMEEPV